MSTTNQNNCACPTNEVVNVPGIQGAPGANGSNPYTITLADLEFTAPGQTKNLLLADASFLATGQIVIVSSDIVGWYTCLVTSVAVNTVSLQLLSYPGDVAIDNTLPAGSKVVISGIQGPQGDPGTSVSPIAGVNPFTDNTGGGATDTLAAGVGVQTLAFYCQLPQITATTILAFTPGYAFKVLGIQWTQEVAVTTAAKAVTLTPSVNGSTVTGGALALTSAACTPKGQTISGSAITAANTGTNVQTLGVVASAVTTFSEGTGWIFLRIQNLDQANAEASIAAKINNILTYLTGI